MINTAKAFGIILASLLFIYSGFNKIIKFDKKVNSIISKTGVPKEIGMLGIIGVICLQIFGFIILMDYYTMNLLGLNKTMVFRVIELIMLFLIVVTQIYHPLKKGSSPIPFLTNLSILGLFIYVYADLSSEKK